MNIDYVDGDDREVENQHWKKCFVDYHEDFYDFEVTDTEGLEDTHNVFVPVECMAAEYPIEDQCYIIPIQEFRALENVKLITE